VSSPSGVWDGATDYSELDALEPYKVTPAGNKFNNVPENERTKFCTFTH